MSDERNELIAQWIEKSAEMRKHLGNQDCASPFVSVAPPGYDPEQVPSVLYVGKATRGLWGDREGAGGPLTRQEQFTSDNLVEYATAWLDKNIWSRGWSRPGAFWYFARSLSSALASAVHIEISELQNLVWTNVCKIGVGNGNPTGVYLDLQKHLSIQTLRFEIRYYMPKVIFWATANYAEDVIDNVVGDPERKTWNTETSELGYWWRNASDGMPAMIWAYHPQGKKRGVLDGWLDKVRDLVAT